MPPDDRAPGLPATRHRGRALAIAVVVVAQLAACSGGGGGGRPDALNEERGTHNAGPLPTLPGGVDLVALDPRAVLVGAELAFGTPLPSQQAVAEGYTADPEVSAAVARRVYVAADGRRLGDALVLVLDGSEVFDEESLSAFERSIVAGIGGGPVTSADMVGREVLRAGTRGRVAVAFRQDDLLTIVRGTNDADVSLVVTRQLEAIARGEVGAADPVTPMISVPGGAAFIPMASVSFEPIPPPEEEPGPEVPTFPGALGVEGRYGVVAGERRTVVWAFAIDVAMYPSAEALAPALPGLVSSRAAGVAPQAGEVVDRVVLTVENPDGTPSASVFRHQGLVLLVEGDRADQVAAVVTAWISALGPG